MVENELGITAEEREREREREEQRQLLGDQLRVYTALQTSFLWSI